jgi:hypothetical protein
MHNSKNSTQSLERERGVQKKNYFNNMKKNYDIDEVDEEMGIKSPPLPGGVELSAITFDDALAIATKATKEKVAFTETPNSSPKSGRKANTDAVKEIFRASHTVGSVSTEQIVRIKKMHDKISDGVNWDFNYACLLTVASIVAGLGLATDSATTVISSMLLSPIMGPVIGMSYGLIIWDHPLIKRSARNELLSILACIIFGMLIGKMLVGGLTSHICTACMSPKLSPLFLSFASCIQEWPHFGLPWQKSGQRLK